jgi:hypothetical protein
MAEQWARCLSKPDAKRLGGQSGVLMTVCASTKRATSTPSSSRSSAALDTRDELTFPVPNTPDNCVPLGSVPGCIG